MSETVLVTGVTGFHGSHALRELAAQGRAKAVGLVRSSRVSRGPWRLGALSESRLRAERLVLDAGGIVVRPLRGERILHAAHPDPTRMLDVVHAVRSPDFAPIREIGTPAAREALIAAGLSPTPIDMLAVDGWFEGAATWNEMGLRPGAPFHLDAADLRWYASITL
jgi:hypothetical protein